MSAQPVHMPCGCPYPPIGDHTPCVHGDCGHCVGACTKRTPGPGLGLVIARQRLTRAVLATLIGPTDMTKAYAGTEQSAADYAEVTEAAKAVVAAQEVWDAAIEAARRERFIPAAAEIEPGR